MAADDPAPVDRAPRTSVMLTAVLFRADVAEPVTNRVANLSATGLRLSPGDGLQAGEIVAVTIGMVQHAPAMVIRCEPGSAALRFLKPIDVAAARQRRPGGAVVLPRAGWLGEMQDAYRR